MTSVRTISESPLQKVSPRKAARLQKIHGHLPPHIVVKTSEDIRQDDLIRKKKMQQKAIYHDYLQTSRKLAAAYYVEQQQQKNPTIACVTIDDNGLPIRKSRPSGWWYHALFGHILTTDVVCRYCMSKPITTLDHVWPVDLGGCSHLHNLVGACRTCNLQKANMPPRAAGMTLHLPLRFFSPETNILTKEHAKTMGHYIKEHGIR